MVTSHGVLRKFPHGSPLANGQIFIDGQVLIRLMASSMTNMRVQVVDGAHVSILETSQHKKGIEIMNSQLSKGGISRILDKISHADREES